MGWPERAGKGWRIRWREGGKSAAGPVFPTKADAEAWGLANGRVEREGVKLTDLLDRWAAAMKAEENGPRASYLSETSVRLAGMFKARGWLTTDDITLEAVQDWRVDTEGRGARALDYLLSVLRWAQRSLRGARIDGRVLALRKRKKRRGVPDRELLTDADIAAILEHAAGLGPHVHALIHYLATYGARPVTALDLTIGDLDLPRGTMVVGGKRSGEWRHPILPETVKLFRAITLGRSTRAERLFLDPRTNEPWALGSDHVAKALTGWYFRAFRDVTPKTLGRIYHLKRYAISRMLGQGLDPATVALFTGHLTISQVLVYARTSEHRATAALGKIAIPDAHTDAHTCAHGIST